MCCRGEARGRVGALGEVEELELAIWRGVREEDKSERNSTNSLRLSPLPAHSSICLHALLRSCIALADAPQRASETTRANLCFLSSRRP